MADVQGPRCFPVYIGIRVSFVGKRRRHTCKGGAGVRASRGPQGRTGLFTPPTRVAAAAVGRPNIQTHPALASLRGRGQAKTERQQLLSMVAPLRGLTAKLQNTSPHW